jgi:3-oxoadipate enol-lactonase
MTAYELGVEIHGSTDAPALVLGPSLGTTRTAWEAVLPKLAERFRVLRYDHLGHGNSAVPPGPYTMDELTGALAATIEAHGITRAHLSGLSLGGMVALQLAATYPNLVDRLAVVCASAYLPPAQNWLDRAAAVRAGGMAAVADTVVGRWFTPAFAESPSARAVRSDLLSTPVEGYAGCCEAIAAMDLRPLLGSIQAPTLVVAGAEDRATPVAHAEAIATGVQGPARVADVTGAAHLAAVERPDKVAQLVVEHFEA